MLYAARTLLCTCVDFVLAAQQSPPGASGTCASSYSIDATWQNNGISYAVVNLYLQDTTSAGLSTPYSVSFSNPDYTSLSSTWNWEVWAGLLLPSQNATSSPL